MSNDEKTLCVVAVAVSSVVSTAEEQHTAAKRKRKHRQNSVGEATAMQPSAYELLVSELHGSDEQLYTKFNCVSPEDLTFCSPPSHFTVGV